MASTNEKTLESLHLILLSTTIALLTNEADLNSEVKTKINPWIRILRGCKSVKWELSLENSVKKHAFKKGKSIFD